METLKAVVPVMAMILIGMLLREKNILNSKSVEGLQALVMNVTLPISLFGTFYKTSLSFDISILPPPYILPLYIEEENKKEFYSSALSIYTLLTIIGFIVLAIVKLG